tara:strand:- start:577 stop:1683 length:1107 start_codon:yes stop_codon:yes gene_type:complete
MIIKKNILIWYWGRHGFAQKYTNQIINELLILNKKKKLYNFYYSYSKNAELSFLYNQIKIHKYPISTFENSTQAFLKTLNLFRIKKKFLLFLNKNKIDKIYCPMFHYWNPYLSSSFKKMNIEYIFGIHDYSLHPGENNLIKQKIYAKEKKNVNKYVCFSEYVKDKLIKNNEIEKQNILLSSLELKHSVYKKKNNIKKLKFIFFGRLMKYKGIEKLINIFSKEYYVKNNISLTIVGSKDKNFNLPKVNTSNISIISGWIDESNIDNIIRKYDVCVLPYEEASQSGVISLMFKNSIPVIVTPVGGLSNQVKNNINGLISKKKNISSFETEIRKILNFNFFYKLRKGAIQQAIDSNKNFSKNTLTLYDFFK